MLVRVERRMVPHVPWALVAVTVALALLGIWNLASASRPPHTPLWTRQTVHLAVGFLAALGVCLVDTRFIQRMAWPLYGTCASLLLLLRIIGHRAKGEASWLALGPVRMEPAEFMKVALVVALARYFHDHAKRPDESYGLTDVWRPVLIAVGAAALVLPDLGNTMMILLTAATVLLFARLRRALLVAGALAVVLLSALVWNDFVRDPSDGHRTVIKSILKRHQSARIAGWLYPDADLRGSGYHAAQSRIAVGSGGFLGKGWGQGTQTGLFFLPEQHTDFIFSVWAEEHGFLACLLLLALYGLIFTTALGVSFQARDRFGAFVCVGVAAMLFWQVFENIGMVVGVLPVTGITLPLLSYGGSSMVSVLLSLGLVANVAMRRHLF
ncbi:MAG TPA: rod shape-determining protein RodA [Myxococcaceae bacterium]|jgi:rod shape determining protein RodA|nr:rod shape-determining protein RodA [Myxococcaceae bacterium]